LGIDNGVNVYGKILNNR